LKTTVEIEVIVWKKKKGITMAKKGRKPKGASTKKVSIIDDGETGNRNEKD